MFKRILDLSHQKESFFLWGPRQVGKSTLLREVFPNALIIDLLRSEEYRRFLEQPELLRERVLARDIKKFGKNEIVVIDEIQKVPQLLNEVHGLIENQGIQFALCGSSARKVKRGHANLLGGRALRYLLFGLVSEEIGSIFDLERLVNHGYLPRHYLSNQPQKLLESYVSDYLKEEIAAEGLVRNLPVFSQFLTSASFSDAEIVNFSTIARDCGVSSHTVQSYFGILEDTLLGRWLPAYTARPKRKVIGAPKFYFSDVGVVNFLAKRKNLTIGSELFGKAFENWIFHELNAYNSYKNRFADLSYWRLSTGIEVDFIVNSMELAIEAKASQRINSDHLKNLRELRKDHPELKTQILVGLESNARKTEDGIWIFPVHEFTHRLWAGEFF